MRTQGQRTIERYAAASRLPLERVPTWTRPMLLLLPGAVILALVFVVPVAKVVAMSVGFPGAIGVRAYADLLTDRYFLRVALRTLELAFGVTLLTLIIGYPVAMYLARSRSRLRHLVFVAVVSPLLVSIVVRTFGWILVFGTEGVINSALRWMGVIGQPLSLLYNPYIVAFALVQVFLPFMVLSITGSLANIDPRLEESAQVLGANPLRTFWHVTLPLSVPGVGAGCALVFGLSMGAYVTPQVLGGGRVQTLTTLIYDYMLVRLDWPGGAAMSLLLLAVVVAFFVCYFAALRRLAAPKGRA